MLSIEEEFEDGQKRLFEVLRDDFVRISISHRMSRKGIVPELWSAYYLWSHAKTLDEARSKHDQACGIN